MTTLTVAATTHWHPADSYGQIACRLAVELARMGVYVNAVSHGETVLDAQPPEVRAITSQPHRPADGMIAVGWTPQFTWPETTGFSGPKIAVTMFESSKLPAAWATVLNGFDAVITPSTFCESVFREGGVSAPIHVIPLGVSEVFQYRERVANRPLTFLAFMDRGERKGGMVAQQAFLRAFGSDERYHLIQKGRESLVNHSFTNANFTTILGDYDEAQMAELYYRADVLIHPHKGEGWGLLPREASSAGCLSLTTPWSGTADNLTDWGVGIPYTLEPAKWFGNLNAEGESAGVWAKVDPARLAKCLREVAEHWEQFKAELPQAAEAARRLYSWSAFAKSVLGVFENVRQETAVAA